MALNLLNDKDFNDYLTDITYQGATVPKQQNFQGEFESADYVFQHRDEIIKGILNQYIKLRVRDYILNQNNEPAFIPVDKNRTDLPGWTYRVFERGENIYQFDGSKMSDKLREDIITVRDYLYDIAAQYVDKVIETAKRTERKPKIRYDYLKTTNEYDTFDKALTAANNWHEHMSEELAKRNRGRELLKKSLVGAKYVMDLPDNMFAYQLTTEEALDFESEYMGHCVGRGGYDAGVKTGLIKIYSIRDERGEPHATLEVRGNEVHQVKGKQNKTPIRKYIPAIKQFLETQKLDVVHDLRNLGLIKQDGKYYDIFNLPKGFVVKGDLNLRSMELTELPDLSTITIQGIFDCSINRLTSLQGAPQTVRGHFWCSFNQLTSLQGASQSIGGDFLCSNNQLTSLDGAPKSVNGCFYCADNQLTSLQGAPQYIGRFFNCANNQLTSLQGAPQSVGDDFICSYNQLTSLQGAPQTVGGDFWCSKNQLTSLQGAPQTVGGDFDCSENQLTSLQGASQSIGGDFNCSQNQLTSLQGAPQTVRGHFWCSYNQLTSLQGAPQSIGGDFNCSNNQLTNLQGAPQTVGGDFDCSENQLTSLDGAPQTVWNFDCSSNKLTNLRGAPQSVYGDFLCSNNQLTSLDGAPQSIDVGFYHDKLPEQRNNSNVFRKGINNIRTKIKELTSKKTLFNNIQKN